MNPPLDLRLAPTAVGTWLACYLGILHPGSRLALLGAAGVLGAILIWWPRRQVRHRSTWRGWASMTLLLGVVATIAATAVTSAQVTHRQETLAAVTDIHEGAALHLRLTSDATEGFSGLGARAVLTTVHASGQVLRGNLPVYVLGVENHWRVGMELTVRGTISPGSRYQAFLRVGQVHTESTPSGIYGVVDRLREGVRAASNGLPPHARGLLPGVSIGDDRRLPAKTQEAMRTTSLTHITAVSGAHVAIVLGSVMFLLGPSPRLVRATMAMCVLGAMVIVVLPTPSVLRASGMGALTIIALGSKRPRLALPVLFAVATALMWWDPWLATSIGFALSTCATLGIVVMAEPLAELGGGGAAARALAVPTAAQLWCAPLLLTFDASIATYAIPANLLALPALAPATISALLSAVLSLLTPSGAAVVAGVGQYFTAWIVTVAEFFAHLPGAKVPWVAGTGGAALLVVASAAFVWALQLIAGGRTWQA